MATAADGTRVFRLQDQTFNSGATVSIQVAGQLPPKRVITHVLFRLDVDITQPAAGAAVQLGAVLHQLVSQFKIGRRISITGLGLKFLNWMTKGFEPSFSSGFPGTLNAVFSRSVVWCISYLDSTSRSPYDACIPVEMFLDPIEVRFGTNAIFAATVPTLGNGTLRTYVVHQAAQTSDDTAVVPQSLNIQSDDFNALVAVINKPGRWLYALAYREASNDAGGISSAQVSNLISYVDGEPQWNNARSQDAASVFNQIAAFGSSLETDNGATPALSQAGEILNDQPGVAAAAGQGTTINYQPLFVPPYPYLVSEVAEARVGAKFEFTGTLGAYKIAYRLVEPRPMSMLAAAARRLGIDDAHFEAKTHSKQDLKNMELLPYLPLRLRRRSGASGGPFNPIQRRY